MIKEQIVLLNVVSLLDNNSKIIVRSGKLITFDRALDEEELSKN